MGEASEYGSESRGYRLRQDGGRGSTGPMKRDWFGWLAAMRWRRRMEQALAGSGVTFRGWLVLVALEDVLRQTGDAVSQNQVAAYLELPRNAVSEVMLGLQDAGMVDRDCSASGRALRIYVTRKAERLLRHCERLNCQRVDTSGP